MSHVSAPTQSRPLAVYWILALGLVSFSFSPILVRFANDEAPALAIAVWRTVFAASLLLPFALARAGAEIRSLTPRERMLILTAGMLLGFHFVTWIESLYHTTIASASVLVTMSPIFLAIFGFLFLKERLTLRVSAGILLAVLGAALIGWGDASGGPSGSLFGNMLALTAALLVSLYLLIGRVVRQGTSWLAYVFPLYAVVALTTLVTALVRHTDLLEYSGAFYGLCLLMAIGPQIIGHGSFNYAIKYFPAALLGLLALLEPVGASMLAYLLFGEVPSPLAFAGMALVLFSIGLAMKRRPRR
jgi:drug/metabolite transporter (DMT)-like permease